MNEVIDTGEHGGEIEMLKDDKTLEKNGVKGGQGNTKTKKKKSRGNLEGKSVDKEAEVGGEDVASSRKVVENTDVTGSEDYVKEFKKKKNTEGKRERKDEGFEHFKVNKDVMTRKAERKKKNKEDNINGGSGHHLREHSVEDVSQATDNKIEILKNVETGQELDGGLVEKVGTKKKKKEKKDKKRDGSGYQFPKQSVEDVSPGGHGMQNGEIVETSDVLDDRLVEKVGKKKRKREKKKNEVEVNLGASQDVTDLPSNATQELENTCTKGFETDGASDKDVTKKSRKKHKTKEKGKELNASSSSQANTNSAGNEKGNVQKREKTNSVAKDDQNAKPEKQKKNGEIVETRDVSDDCLVEKVGKKKRKREKKKNEVEGNLGASQDVADLPSNATKELENTSTKGFATDGASDKDVTQNSRKRHKTKELHASGSSKANSNSAGNEKGNVQKGEKDNSVAKDGQNTKPEKQKKKVKFSDQVEVFPLSDNEVKLVRGKRFSPEEDEIVRKAVNDYIEAHCLGDEGLNMVLNCRSHPEVRNCWKEIASAIPYRPRDAVYHRAQNLFRRSETTKWTKEEYETIKEFQKKHGNQWKLLTEDLKKHRVHIKDTWRRLRLSNTKKGQWNQEEYQDLFDLVNLDLKTRYKEEKKSKHGMLRDNICWTAISDKLTTRSDAICCQKWYDQLTSSLVAEGEWADADDYRLINALYELDASCIEDVDWDNLLEHRDGDVCRKRWNQMVLHIGYRGTQSFGEQVEVLAKRYCPDLIEVREVWDNKPYVD